LKMSTKARLDVFDLSLHLDSDTEKTFKEMLKESVEHDKSKPRVSQNNFFKSSKICLDDKDQRSSLSKYGSSLSKSLLILFLISITSMGIYLGVYSYQNADDGSLSAIYHFKLSAKMQFPFNLTASHFSHKNTKFDPNEIPLLLNDKARNNFGRNVLSDCFGLKGITLKEFNEEERYKNKPYSHDFYVSITSLCDFTHLNPSSNKFRVISFIQNPIISYATKYNNTVLSSNPLTRSIVCKPNNGDKLKHNDVLTAKKFLKDICDVSMVSNYYEFNKKLLKRYNWESKDANNDKKCELNFMERFTQLSHPINADELQQIVEKNSEDLSIYFDLNK